MNLNNVVVLRGRLSSEPMVRSLPSGDVVTQLELTMPVAGRATSVPVALHNDVVGAAEGDDVVVTGHVSRRFFRAGGSTQSRTEVVASEVIKASKKRTAERAVEGVVALLIDGDQ